MKKEITTLCIFSALLLVGPSVAYCYTCQGKEEANKKIEKSGEKIKSKIQEAVDSIDEKKVNESIDKVADYLDRDKLKQGVDEIADYLDREKIKEFIDYAADYLDREKIKTMIDVVADSFDPEKIKQMADQAIGSLDKEKIKETANWSVDQVTTSLKEVTQSLEQEIQQVGNDKQAVQNMLKRYNWNHWIPDRACYGPATLTDLKLGGRKSVVIAKPGQSIDGEVVCSVDRRQCSPLGLYRVVLGIKDQGGQTTIFNHFGLRAGKETDHFTLIAPQQKGVYQVGFRVVEAAREGTAIKAWDDRDENGWGEPVVIGLIIVA